MDTFYPRYPHLFCILIKQAIWLNKCPLEWSKKAKNQLKLHLFATLEPPQRFMASLKNPKPRCNTRTRLWFRDVRVRTYNVYITEAVWGGLRGTPRPHARWIFHRSSCPCMVQGTGSGTPARAWLHHRQHRHHHHRHFIITEPISPKRL